MLKTFVLVLCLSIATFAGMPVGQTAAVGAGWTADSLANLEIGKWQRQVDYEFIAQHSGMTTDAVVFLVFRTICDTCYADGDGGIILVQLTTDDGAGHPGDVLTAYTITDPFTKWNRSVPLFAVLQAGIRYHLLFSNLSNDPQHNFTSIDDLYAKGSHGNPSYGALYVNYRFGDDGSWIALPDHTPIFSLGFADGFRQGQAYMDVRRNTVHDYVSEQFSLASPAVVSKASMRVAGSGMLTLYDSAHVALAFGFVDAYNDWATMSFAPLRLAAGKTYYLELAGDFDLSPLQQGAQYGFVLFPAQFSGHCMIANGQYCIAGRPDFDAPFFLQ